MTHDNKNVKIIAFVGLTGSGKTTAVNYLTQKGYPKVYGGGIFYDEMKEAGLELTPENEDIFRHKIRKDNGQDRLVQKLVDQIHHLIDAGQHRIITDSNYSWEEYKIMKHEFPGELYVIALIAPKHMRHHRLANRPERPLTEAEANKRDWQEIEDLQSGGTIAMADHYIVNDGDFDNLNQQINQTLENIDFFN